MGNCPIGYEYDRSHYTREQRIIIGPKGKFIKQCFELRVIGHTCDMIIAKLRPYGINLYKQALIDLFKNPFNCGLISHNFLNGELVIVKQEALIDQNLFLKVNHVKQSDGFKVNSQR